MSLLMRDGRKPNTCLLARGSEAAARRLVGGGRRARGAEGGEAEEEEPPVWSMVNDLRRVGLAGNTGLERGASEARVSTRSGRRR